jgi:hypothetical protein
MNRSFYLIVALILILVPVWASGQLLVDIPDAADYVRLLNATKFVGNYKEMAAVSARVFGARNQGSDKEFSRAMAVIAAADLTDAEGCLIGVYRTQDLTRQDIVSLVSLFESPLGVKLLQQSQRKLIADVERLSIQPFPANVFTEEEKREIVALQKSVPFRKYSLMSVNREFVAGMIRCITQSRAVKDAGIKF